MVLKSYKLAFRKDKTQTIVDVDGLSIGGGNFTIIAGPCAVESRDQILTSARLLKKMGVKIMRASIVKPRTSPYSFQGLGMDGLKLLKEVKEETGLLIESEVMNRQDIPLMDNYVDIFRVGSRNMQNFDLLKKLGTINKPIILKRGMSATIEEFLLAAEYILVGGNKNVILCERGIRTFENSYRNTLDISSIIMLKKETNLPVIVDPSHAAGNRDLVPALSKAAASIEADGLLLEMHPNPENALSDGQQSLYPRQLETLLKDLSLICATVGKKL